MLLIGIGNAFGRDDGVGLKVAESFLGRPGLKVVSHHGEGTELMQLWQGHDAVVLVDACSSGHAPGTVMRFDVTADGLPPAYVGFSSSHQVGVPEAIELSRTLGSLPRWVVIVAIEGDDFTPGVGLTPAVEGACEEARAMVERELAALAAAS